MADKTPETDDSPVLKMPEDTAKATTLEAFKKLTDTKKVNEMFWMSRYANKSNKASANMKEFINDHMDCHEEFLVTGTEVCKIVKQHDGHPKGFDPTKYGILWKKNFAKAFVKARKPFEHLADADWHEKFMLYIKDTNKGDQIIERACIVPEDENSDDGSIDVPLSDKKKPQKSSLKRSTDTSYMAAKKACDDVEKKLSVPGRYAAKSDAEVSGPSFKIFGGGARFQH